MTCCSEGEPYPNRPAPNTHNVIKYSGLVTSLRRYVLKVFCGIFMALARADANSADSARASMDLPQEIIDEVIDNLAFDFRTLKSTSLVQRSWTHRSRRRLFYFVPLNSLDRLEQWSTSISAGPEGIASYPRVIRLSHDTPKSWVDPTNLAIFHEHFCSFSGVENLVISGLETTKFDTVTTPLYFGNFVQTVRSLELLTAVGTPASLVSFICAFPLMEDLTIAFPNTTASGGDQGEVTLPAFAPNFKGKLKLLDMFHESDPTVELLCALPLPFHTISISSRATGRLPQLAKLLKKCGKTLRSLHIARKTHGKAFIHLSTPGRGLSAI